MNYNEISNIELNSLIIFKSYTIDRHEKKHIQDEIKGNLVVIIQENEGISQDLIQTYYPEKPYEDYPMLSQSQFLRLVIQYDTNKSGVPMYTTIELNPYFLSVGFQTLEVIENPVMQQPKIPSQILGFNSYEIGKKFKN